MNYLRTAVGLFRLYFWVLIVAAVIMGVWVVDQFVVEGDLVATSWMASVGFGVMLVVLLIVIRRVAL